MLQDWVYLITLRNPVKTTKKKDKLEAFHLLIISSTMIYINSAFRTVVWLYEDY